MTPGRAAARLVRACPMSLPAPESSPLVYVQNDDFFAVVGEPLPLHDLRRVVVAKWDSVYADALRNACVRAFPDTPVEVCRRGEDALRALRENPADLALLGLTFVDLDGVDVLQAIARERLATRVMVVSGRKDEHSLQALRAVRFDGFFDPLAESPEALVDALQQVASGRGYISPSLRRELFAQRSAGILALRLTPAELQVLGVIGDGSDDREAAERLGMSEATVQTHRRNLMRKLDVTTSAKLVREAVRLGVVRIKPDGTIVRPGFDRLSADRARKPPPSSPA
jgi:DNA-binding NarL/FixJ family response regulator